MRVDIVEDQHLMRSGIVHELEDSGFTVRAFATTDEFRAASHAEVPDVAILDVRLPPHFSDEGLRLARELRAEHPSVGVLVLSQHIELDFVSDLIEHDSTGTGYLLKDRVLDRGMLVGAIETIAHGGCVIDPSLVRRLMDAGSGPVGRLSERDVAVLREMASGRSNAAIARELHLSERSVEAAIQRVFQTLGLPEDSAANRRVLAVLRYLAESR